MHIWKRYFMQIFEGQYLLHLSRSGQMVERESIVQFLINPMGSPLWLKLLSCYKKIYAPISFFGGQLTWDSRKILLMTFEPQLVKILRFLQVRHELQKCPNCTAKS